MEVEAAVTSQKSAKSIQLSFDEILKILPQKPPFVMVDRVIELIKGERIVAIKNSNLSELRLLKYEKDISRNCQFPDIMVSEAMGQAGIIFFKNSIGKMMQDPMIYLGSIDIRFSAHVFISNQLTTVVAPIKLIPKAAILHAKTYLNRKLVAEGEMSLSVSQDKL